MDETVGITQHDTPAQRCFQTRHGRSARDEASPRARRGAGATVQPNGVNYVTTSFFGAVFHATATDYRLRIIIRHHPHELLLKVANLRNIPDGLGTIFYAVLQNT